MYDGAATVTTAVSSSLRRDELDFEFRMRIHELIESLPKAGD